MLPRLTLLLALALTGCIRDDPNHCANKDGDATCERYYSEGLCSSCTAKQDGCVGSAEIAKDPSCHVGGGGTTQADDDDSADPTSMSMSMSMSSDSIADDSATSTPMDTTTEPTTAEDDGSSSSDGGDLPRCGNDVIDTAYENCDGMDQPATMCSQISLPGGAVGCFPAGSENECTYDLTDCDDIQQCNNMEIEGNEQCEAGVPMRATCESVDPTTIGGELGCTDCMFNTTNCTPCVPNNGDCTSLDQCCAATLCLSKCIL